MNKRFISIVLLSLFSLPLLAAKEPSKMVKLCSGYEMRRTQERASRVFDKQKLADTIQLNSGFNMPILGLGTWTLTGQVCDDAVYKAMIRAVKEGKIRWFLKLQRLTKKVPRK